MISIKKVTKNSFLALAYHHEFDGASAYFPRVETPYFSDALAFLESHAANFLPNGRAYKEDLQMFECRVSGLFVHFEKMFDKDFSLLVANEHGTLHCVEEKDLTPLQAATLKEASEVYEKLPSKEGQ